MRIDKNTTIRLGNRNIVKIKIGDSVIWQKTTGPEPVGPDYFYIENTYAGTNTISLKDNESFLLLRDLQYSKDKDNWTTFTPSTTALDISLNQGEKLYIRGSENQGGVRLKISGSQAHIVGGNINTLIKYDDPNNVTISQYAFIELFEGDKKLTSASNLKLPATTLKMRCYSSMFSGCSALTTAPELPATTLAADCYMTMFQYCRSLTTAPALPATTLANQCYRFMFDSCSSLTTAPALPATTLTQSCYESMFNYCSSLTTAPALPATTLTQSCYESMFNYCTSLTTAPTLPATTLETRCYQGMFSYCNSLNYIKCLALNDSSNTNDFRTYCEGWVDGVSSSGTFISSDYYSKGWYWGNDGVPKNWTTKTESGNPFEPSSNGGTQIYQSNGLTVYEMGSSQGGYAVQANGNVMEVYNFQGNDYCFAMMKISSDQGYGATAYITPNIGNGVTAYISNEVYDDGNCPFSYNYNDESNNVLYSLTSSDNGIQKSQYITGGNCIWVKFVKNQGTYVSDYPSISMDF